MAFTTGVQIKGGKKLEAVLKKAEKNKGKRKKEIKVGFFPSAKYDDKDATPVAVVAAISEFGRGHVPERPFFRRSIAELEDGLPKQLRGILDPETMTVSAADAAKIGAYAVGIIQDQIRAMQDPPNAPATIKRKGSDSPLQDTDKMLDSVDYEVE